ncbi:Aminoacyl tRNA synthase complex-interacting multifunctional protein 1 [Coemansia sp. RSA 1286]|nr:Aminoacyl tRNA synthase complex-interacting multifunctional protein 1 [Coemansia sp. RSA 1286]
MALAMSFRMASRLKLLALPTNRLALTCSSKSFSVSCTRGSLTPDTAAPADACAESDPFDKVDLRVGIVELVKKHEQADSLYVLSVNLGEKPNEENFANRTIVSGLVGYYSEQQLQGKKVVVLANMKPRKLRGVVSQGMLLAATGAEANGSVIVQVLEAGKAARAGDPVCLQGSEKTPESPSIEKSPIKRQRVIDAFIDGLSLNSCVASYRGQKLVTGNEHVTTRSLQSGVVG